MPEVLRNVTVPVVPWDPRTKYDL